MAMSETQADMWSEWLLNRRFGGNQQLKLATEKPLQDVRDKLLSHARLHENDLLLDVGCGDGLVGFGAIEKVPSCQVLFSDISQSLLDYTRSKAAERGLLTRCRFMKASADELSALGDETIDAVTTRSVLMYVSAKAQAFQEFYRVLKPGGRLSIFEPINRFIYPWPDHVFFGYEITAVKDIVQKLKQVYFRCHPPGTDPMLDFDEYDLIAFAEQAGFPEVHLELQAEIRCVMETVDLQTVLRMSPTPRAPTMEEAIGEALSATEASCFVNYLREMLKAQPRTRRSSVAYLWATKYPSHHQCCG